MALQKAMVSSKSNEWSTPKDFYDSLHLEFNFTLDPCATNDNHKCDKFYTLEDNGLAKSWVGEKVFMNPPYGGHTGDWIKKAYEESKNKNTTVVCLIVSSTDRSYWHEYIFPYAAEIRFIRGRLKFNNSKNTAPFASAIVIFDENKSFINFKDYKSRVKFNQRIFIV